MQKLGITAVVNMRESQVHKPDQFKWLSVLNLPTKDWTPPSIENLQAGSKFIDRVIQNGGSVYIHCHQGLGRGPSMAIAYLMSTGMTFDDAFTEVKKVRPFIVPTRAQIERLKEFEKTLQKKDKKTAS
jgi:dual specificity MAP kinase phosphatase